MNNGVLMILAMGFGLCLLTVAGAQDKPSVFVATSGSDDAAGTIDQPFNTLERARDAVRELKRQGKCGAGATVNVRGGEYYRDRTFELTAEDSGAETGKIVYCAYENEDVRFTGGREISGFAPVIDASVRGRLDEAARGNVLQADLKTQGVTDFGSPVGLGSRLELFFNGKAMTLARYPNEGYLTIDKVTAGKNGGRFTYKGDRHLRWEQAEDLWLFGYWYHNWSDQYQKVESIDADKAEIVLAKPYHGYGYRVGGRWYAQNLLEEIDQPGEFYVNRDTGILYFWPPAPIEESSAVVSVLKDTMVTARDASHVVLSGFTFECTRGSVVSISGGTGNLVTRCTMRNTGGSGVAVNGGTRHSVDRCHMYDLGTRGIQLNGGDRKTLTPAGHSATNNHIHHFARLKTTYQPAIALNGVGNRMAHNHIHHCPHMAAGFGGNEHVIEFNDIHHSCQDTGDVGAIYTGRNWTMRGTVVRHNFIHETGGVKGWSMGVYLDDAFSGTTIYGNVFYKVRRAAFIGGGRDNKVINNLFVDCAPAIHIDTRGLGWAKGYIAKGGGWHMYQKLAEVNYDKPPYSERYPALARILDEGPAEPRGNVILRNVIVRGTPYSIAQEEHNRIEDNLVIEDPGFVDEAALNFQLRDDSPVWETDFERIPFEEIGIEAEPAD